jgi:hypothetical protein
VEITRSLATRLAIRQEPGRWSGSTFWPATSASSATASACPAPSASSATAASTAIASLTSPDTSAGCLRVIPGAVGLARPVVVMGDQLDPAGLRHQAADPADRRDQLGDRVLGRHGILQDGGVQHPPTPTPSTPVASTTWPTASKIRLGRGEVRSRARQDTSTVG